MRLSGRLRSSLIIGGQGIRARKMRTFLSMISLFLGVLAVVSVQAGSVIAERALLSDMEMQVGKDGTRMFYLPAEATELGTELVAGRTDAVASNRLRAVIGEPNVRPINEGGGPVDDAFGSYAAGPSISCDDSGVCQQIEDPNATAPQGQAIEVALQSLTGDIRQFRPFRLESGQFLDFDSAPSLAPRLVLNTKAAEAFRQFRVPAEMSMAGAQKNMTPQFVGVVNDGGWGPQAYVRADELANWLPTNQKSDPMYGGGTELMAAPTATDLEPILRARMVANDIDPTNMYVQTVNSRSDLESQLELMRWIFLGMAALVLLIGVAGILNVGLATVGERIEEFALRRAVGTPRLLLAGIVLAETLLTGLLTAGAAIGVGVVGLEAASMLFGTQEPFLANVAFPWQAGVAGVVAGLVAGVLGGLVPAIRAAKIPIATVMRA